MDRLDFKFKGYHVRIRCGVRAVETSVIELFKEQGIKRISEELEVETWRLLLGFCEHFETLDSRFKLRLFRYIRRRMKE